MVLALQCLSSSVTEVCPPQIDTASFLREPERQAETCPDALKSTDFNLSYLYQISPLAVKKNHRMTGMPERCDFRLQAPHSPTVAADANVIDEAVPSLSHMWTQLTYV